MSCYCSTTPMPPCSWCENGGVQTECEASVCFHECETECKVASLEPREFGRYVRCSQRDKEQFFDRNMELEVEIEWNKYGF